MTLRILVLILCILILFGCKSGSNHETSSVTIKKPGTIAETKLNTLPVDTPRYDQGEYALIVNIIQQNTSTYIIADYIQYLKGQAAIDAATRAHEADTFQTEDGKTHIGVQSDYFIANENKRLRRLELDKNCTFDLILNPDNPNRTPGYATIL